MKMVATVAVVNWVLLGFGTPTSVVQYGALGLLSFVVVWFCLRGFPAILRALEARERKYEAVIQELKREIQQLRKRDKQMSQEERLRTCPKNDA